MAHGITNQDSVGYAEKGAWHGLGVVWPAALTPIQAASLVRWSSEPVTGRRSR